jgi:hypothetical protein
VNIIDPAFPDPGLGGTAPPTNRYLLAEERDMAYSQRLSAGVAQTFGRRVNTNVLYSYSYRYSLLVGRNLNTPINGVRPDPQFANVVLASPDSSGTQHYVNASVNVNLSPMPAAGGGPMGGGGPVMVRGDAHMVFIGGPPAPGAASGPLFSWRRGLTIGTFYNWGRDYTDTEGAFAIPASLRLSEEWGPASFDRRHNAHVAITSSALRNMTARFSWNGSSAPPLTIRTGFDDNGDLVFNDRPVGVGRNSARTLPTYGSSASVTYNFTLGKKQVTSGSGVQISGGPGGLTVNPTGMQTTPRYRLSIGANISNVFNRPVYSGFSGVITSPFFLQPTSASGVRRFTFSSTVTF